MSKDKRALLTYLAIIEYKNVFTGVVTVEKLKTVVQQTKDTRLGEGLNCVC